MSRSCIWMLGLLALGAGTAACQPDTAADETEPVTDVAVTVAPVVRTTLHGYVTGWGTVEPESATAGRPPASAAVAAPVAGQISAIEVQEGQRVGRGDVLFRLDSRVADVAVDRARQAVEFAESVAARQEALGPGEATSMRAFQEAQQQLMAARVALSEAEVQREFLDVRAPIDGTVTRVHAKLGDAIDPSTVLADLIDLNRLVVNAAVRSVDVSRVAPGQVVEFSPGAAPGVPAGAQPAVNVEATVQYIGAEVDSTTDTVLVRARLGATSGLRPGQFVNARILTDERMDQLAVPVESIVEGADGPEVAIVQGDTATRIPVTTGLREDDLIQVEGAGLREGMPVVVQGAYGLPPTTKVTIIGD